MYIHIYIYIFIYSFTHINLYTHTQTHTQTDTHARTRHTNTRNRPEIQGSFAEIQGSFSEILCFSFWNVRLFCGELLLFGEELLTCQSTTRYKFRSNQRFWAHLLRYGSFVEIQKHTRLRHDLCLVRVWGPGHIYNSHTDLWRCCVDLGVYGVATISRLLKMSGLVCKGAL